MNIGRFSVKNPVLINILMTAVIVIGTLSFLRLPRELMSDVSFSWVFIAVPYPGASAEVIEKSITVKVENELSNISEIKKLTSITKENVAFFRIEFNDRISKEEFNRLYQDVRTEFDKVELPEGTLEPWTDDFSSSDFMPMITVILEGDESVTTAQMNQTALQIRDRIINIKNISKAEVVGGQEREVWVECSRSKLEAYGISLDEIANAIKQRNTDIPGGKVKTGTQDYLISTMGELSSLNDFKNVIIRKKFKEGTIKVSDLAKINSGYAPSHYDVRHNGNKAVTLLISKTREGNSIELSNRIKKTLHNQKDKFPSGIDISFFNDTSRRIEETLGTLITNAAAGFFLLIAILVLFIGPRYSLITALGIPVTFAITFIFMDLSKESFNGNSLFALVMVLGLIVDDAIVIIENCYRHRELGLGPHEAGIQGTNEVIKPVVAGTLTTIAAFLPFMLLPGIMGKFMKIIPVIVSLALFASTLEALFILPSHFAEWGGKIDKKRVDIISSIRGWFKTLLAPVYKHRYLTLSVASLIIFLSMALMPFLKQELFGNDYMSYFYIDIKMKPGTSRNETNRVTSRFEEKLLPLVKRDYVSSVITTVGFLTEEKEWITASNVAQITVDLAQKGSGRKRKAPEILDEIRNLCDTIPGAESVKFRLENSGPPKDKPVTFHIRGDDLDEMGHVALEYTQMLRETDGLYNISRTNTRGSNELRVDIDEEKASLLGLSTAQIGKYIRDCFDGITCTKYFDNDEELDVIVKFDSASRSNIQAIRQMKIPAHAGRNVLMPDTEIRQIPFQTVCSLKKAAPVGQIKRVDNKREITVSADAVDSIAKNRGAINTLNKKITSRFNDLYRLKFPDQSLKIGGEFAEMNNIISDMIPLLAVGFFLIYLILGAQFKSYFQPLIIGFSIPFAMVGTVIFLFVTSTPFSVVVIYAAVALTGICVNDSIVLISYINNLKRRGMGTKEAVIEGTAIRLRPILLTSITTISGLLPMALGLGGYSTTWGPMASTISFGLLFSTVGTLIVIPCIYGILDDFLKKTGIKMKLEGE